MNQAFRSLVWLLLICVVLSALVPDAVDHMIAKAVQASAGRYSSPDLSDLDDDSELLDQTATKTSSARLTLGGPNAVVARIERPAHDLQAQPYDQSAFASILPSSPSQMLSLRL